MAGSRVLSCAGKALYCQLICEWPGGSPTWHAAQKAFANAFPRHPRARLLCTCKLLGLLGYGAILLFLPLLATHNANSRDCALPAIGDPGGNERDRPRCHAERHAGDPSWSLLATPAWQCPSLPRLLPERVPQISSSVSHGAPRKARAPGRRARPLHPRLQRGARGHWTGLFAVVVMPGTAQ